MNRNYIIILYKQFFRFVRSNSSLSIFYSGYEEGSQREAKNKNSLDKKNGIFPDLVLKKKYEYFN